MSIALVTGSAGFIGSALVDDLRAKSTFTTVIGADIRPGPWTDVIADVTDHEAVGRLPWTEITTCFHLASVVGVPNYLADPLAVIDTVIDGTRNVANLCEAYGVAMVHASTSEVYGRNPAVPWREDSDRVLGATTIDRWCYASAKGTAEHMLCAMRRRGLRVAIARFFNVYGPRQAPIYAVSAPIHSVLNGCRPELHAPGSQTRCFTYVGDAVDGLQMIAGQNDVFNIGSTLETPISYLIALIQLQAGTDLKPIEVPNPYQDDILRRVPDTTEIKALGWKPLTILEHGLADTIDWAREHPEWLGWTAKAA